VVFAAIVGAIVQTTRSGDRDDRREDTTRTVGPDRPVQLGIGEAGAMDVLVDEALNADALMDAFSP
jgi:hypothetical protein